MKLRISIDDGADQDYRVAKLLLKYGVEGIFYWPVDMEALAMIKGWECLTPQHEAFIAENFEIGSHGITHDYLTQIPFEAAVDEIVTSKKILEKKYDREIKEFCYPRGYASEEHRNVVKNAGYVRARSTRIGHIGRPEDPYYASTAVHIGCPIREEYKGTTWLEYGLKLFEQAKAENKDYEGFLHGWELDRYGAWKDFEYFLKEITR